MFKQMQAGPSVVRRNDESRGSCCCAERLRGIGLRLRV